MDYIARFLRTCTVLLIGAVVWGALDAAPAQAQTRSTNYAGFGCLAGISSSGDIRRNSNYVYSFGANNLWVYCPVVRRHNMDAEPSVVHVNVRDGSASGNLACYYYVTHPFNTGTIYYMDSWVVPTNGVGDYSCEVGWGQTSLGDLAQWYHKILVLLPAYDSTNGSSRVYSYEVLEDPASGCEGACTP